MPWILLKQSLLATAAVPPNEMKNPNGNFFRQSAWLGVSTLAAGALMTLVHSVAAKLPNSEYAAFGSMLKVFLLLGMPTAGVQNVFARHAAATLSETDSRVLSRTTRGVVFGIGMLWLALLVGTLLCKNSLVIRFGLADASALWPTLGMTLTWLLLPVFRGLLQGQQNFVAFGWVGILDAAGRFGSIFLLFHWGHQTAAEALYGAWFGQVLATSLAVWTTRHTWMAPGSAVAWARWFREVFPLTVASAGLLILANFDYPFLTWIIPSERRSEFDLGRYYFPATMIGFALTQVTVPLAMVMFPKLTRSAATRQKTNVLFQALAATAALGFMGVMAVAIFPELPLRILFISSPEKWAAAPLVPWMVSAMLAYALANVMVNSLVARARWKVIPWIAAVAVGYVLAFWQLAPWLLKQPPMPAFRYAASLIALANLLMLLIAFVLAADPPKSAIDSDAKPT